MLHQEFQENWKIFSDLVDNIPMLANKQMSDLVKKCIDQHLIILSDVFFTSIDTLKDLQNVNSVNEIICLQTKFTNEISKRISLSTQRFLNTSLGDMADYNEWLKAHCDLATD